MHLFENKTFQIIIIIIILKKKIENDEMRPCDTWVPQSPDNVGTTMPTNWYFDGVKRWFCPWVSWFRMHFVRVIWVIFLVLNHSDSRRVASHACLLDKFKWLEALHLSNEMSYWARVSHKFRTNLWLYYNFGYFFAH